jgi:DNA repair protein RadC
MRISNAIGEMKITYRTTGRPSRKINRSQDGYDFLKEVWDHDLMEYQEQMCLIALSRSNYIVGYEFIASGGTAGVIVDPKMIFQAVLLANASSFILAHNHPSGALIPSEQDKRLTERVTRIARDLDIPLLDHLIVTKDGFMSFADQGIL